MGMWPAIMVLRGCGNCLLGVLRGVTFDISVFVQRLVVGRRSDAEAMRFDVSSWQKKKKNPCHRCISASSKVHSHRLPCASFLCIDKSRRLAEIKRIVFVPLCDCQFIICSVVLFQQTNKPAA